jgi:polysaccharide biosynthesis/export protein
VNSYRYKNFDRRHHTGTPEMRRRFSAMTKELVLLFLIPGTLCAAQSMLVMPTASVQQDAGDVPTRNSGAASSQGNAQGGVQDISVPDLNRYTTDLPAQPNSDLTLRPVNRSSRIVGPLKTKSEFQQYAEDETGRRLPVYGRLLFDQVPSTFAPVENVPVPADYVVGPGDQLLIRAWGKIELNSRVTVDRNGQISLPRAGTVTVAGLHYSQVESFLRSAVGALFKDFELNVSLGQLRTIQVYVLGNARQPGAYTVGSLSTLVDALFWSGGPSATGTMRNIQLRRDGKIISDFDLYDLIAKGDKSRDQRLLPGDVIFIPAIGPQIAVSGDVNQPGIFELKGSSTAGSAVAIAGGMTSLASAERAVLERIENHSSRTVEEFSLDFQGQSREMKDGDLLRIFPLSPKFANAVTLRGNVALPGLYPWKEGMRISDIIPSRSALITREYWNQQNHLVRPIPARPFAAVHKAPSGDQQTDMLGTQQADMSGNQPDSDANRRVDAFGNPRVGATGRQGIEISENVDLNRSTKQNADQSEVSQGADPDQKTVSPTVMSVGKNSAEINWEYALIERLDERNLSTHLIPFRLASAIDDPASADNQPLKPGDVVTIFSRADLELPMEKHATFVRVGGEVNAPGIYRVNPGETLSDVVKQAGGLTPHSYLYAAIFTRVSTRIAQETQLRQSTEQMQRELISRYANATPLAGQSATTQQAQLAMQQTALARLSSIKPTGRVVLAMKPDAASIADVPDFPLEDGDTFYIPPRLSTIQVSGAVYNANAFRYEQGQRLRTYLDAAGGPTRQADARRMFVIRADGSVLTRQSRTLHSHGKYENLKLLPGDAVVVPEKLRINSVMSEILQWTQITSQLALTSAALNVIR